MVPYLVGACFVLFIGMTFFYRLSKYYQHKYLDMLDQREKWREIAWNQVDGLDSKPDRVY